MIEIRTAKTSDYSFVENLFIDNMIGYYHRHKLQFSKTMFAEIYKTSEGKIITKDGERVGFLRFTSDEKILHISELQIVSSCQKAGLGSLLLAYIHSVADELGLKFVSLNVFKDNPAANLYRRNGYRWIMEQGDKPIRKMIREKRDG